MDRLSDSVHPLKPKSCHPQSGICGWEKEDRLDNVTRDPEEEMKKHKKGILALSCIFTLTLFACVTINIYFPAEKVESVAGKIVDDIRGNETPATKKPAPDKDSHLLKKTLLALVCTKAYADEPLTVSNPTIRALKQQMKKRYARMKPYYEKGYLEEGNGGYVKIKKKGGLGLKQTRDLKNLVKAENADRKKLYGEIARALKIDPSQVGRIGKIFGKEWQRSVR